MAKARIGHFVEAQILEHLGIDFIDESEVLTPADEENHINKHKFKVPFVCGARNLGEALRRISEGAAMIRTKGEAGTGSISIFRLYWRFCQYCSSRQSYSIDNKERYC
jgi:pyridoxal 5'-phosphate synthase pdxS subunit